MDARGGHNEKQVRLIMTISHEDTYLLSGDLFAARHRRPRRRAGLRRQAELVESVYFFKTLELLGATMQVCLQ